VSTTAIMDVTNSTTPSRNFLRKDESQSCMEGKEICKHEESKEEKGTKEGNGGGKKGRNK
jgi:hypothetical protein